MPFAPLLRTSAFPLQDVSEPELYREQFPYAEIPRILFDGMDVPLAPAKDIWITDTTFRDGQQARPPYTPEQIVRIFELLHKLSGPNGVIRQSEFFIYSQRDRRAVEGCLELGYQFPEVTSWIRADAGDLALVKSFGIKETGILTSVSDYHIYLKLMKTRRKALDDFLGIVKATLDEGIIPRCHFEDITRADIYGFCLPFAEELLKLSQEYGLPVKVRLCDTMGYGVTFPQVTLPRSIPRMVHAFVHELGYPGEWLEWHGHNDFHKVHTNAVTSWLYGISALNASLLGFGERTGNPPLEGAIIEYISLLGSPNGVDTRVITEIADYFRGDIQAIISSNYPFVGSEFNTTRAGIHADGLLKNPEIYNIFDTEAILNRPLKITVTDKSGVAGIAAWINENVPLITGRGFEPVGKRHPGIKLINNWIVAQYEQGRTTSISPEELEGTDTALSPLAFHLRFRKGPRGVGAQSDASGRTDLGFGRRAQPGRRAGREFPAHADEPRSQYPTHRPHQYRRHAHLAGTHPARGETALPQPAHEKFQGKGMVPDGSGDERALLLRPVFFQVHARTHADRGAAHLQSRRRAVRGDGHRLQV